MRSARPAVRLLGVAVVACCGALLFGCADNASTPAPTPSTSAPSQQPPVVDPSPSPVGLTVRYLDRDGSIKTLRVEDFPH